jgi:hypothetical protein
MDPCYEFSHNSPLPFSKECVRWVGAWHGNRHIHIHLTQPSQQLLAVLGGKHSQAKPSQVFPLLFWWPYVSRYCVKLIPRH